MLIAILSAAPATASWAEDECESACERAPLGTPEELEAAGTVVGQIYIRVNDIFDLSDPRESGFFYRMADDLHRSTRDSAVAAQLQFKSGDPFVARKLAESERALREVGYLADAKVRPIARHGNEVDVEVIVRDVWTTLPAINIGRAGGKNRASLSLEEHNLLGYGKSLTFDARKDVDRTSTGLRYDDPNVFGSRWRMGLQYADNSDGHTRELLLTRPFTSLDTPWSVTGDYAEDDHEQTRYSLGHEVDRFRSQLEYLNFEGGVTAKVENGWAQRWLFGITRDDIQFEQLDQQPLVGVMPEDRRFLYPWVGWEIYQDDFAKTENLNQIGRVEDLYLGTEARFQLGFSPSEGSTPATLLFDTRALTSFTWDAEQKVLQLAAHASGRAERTGGVDAGLLETSGDFYWRSSDRHVWFARLEGSVAHDLDPDTQLLLGGDSGLRGYPLRFQGGTSRALLTLEHRYFTDWYPLRLARVGAAVFFDAGRTWGPDVVGTPNLGLLKDVGVGLRLGNTRSSHGSVFHFDLAFPLDRTTGIDSVQFLIQTKGSF